MPTRKTRPKVPGNAPSRQASPAAAPQEGAPIGTGTPLTKQPLAPSSGQAGAKKG